MTATQQSTRTALWLPGWYELDQPLTLQTAGRFWFFQHPPGDLPNVESYDFVFFNQMSAAANCQVRMATIASIDHSQLGPLKQIDTDGLDYVFHPIDGQSLTVNAEEEPGKVYEGPMDITDWSVHVILSDVSEPLTDGH